MTARLLDGKRIADELIENIRHRVRARVRAGEGAPGLAVASARSYSARLVSVRSGMAGGYGTTVSPFPLS